MKTILCILFAQFMMQGAAGQQSWMEKVLNNDSVRYRLLLISPHELRPKQTILTRYIVSIGGLDPATVGNLKCQPVKFWKDKLTSESSDWAAVILLHAVYDLDADWLLAYNTRAKWLPYKAKQMEYFLDFIARHRPGRCR